MEAEGGSECKFFFSTMRGRRNQRILFTLSFVRMGWRYSLKRDWRIISLGFILIFFVFYINSVMLIFCHSYMKRHGIWRNLLLLRRSILLYYRDHKVSAWRFKRYLWKIKKNSFLQILFFSKIIFFHLSLKFFKWSSSFWKNMDGYKIFFLKKH